MTVTSLTSEMLETSKSRALLEIPNGNSHGCTSEDFLERYLGHIAEAVFHSVRGTENKYHDPYLRPDVPDLNTEIKGVRQWRYGIYIRNGDKTTDFKWVLVAPAVGCHGDLTLGSFFELKGWATTADFIENGVWTDFGNGREQVLYLSQDKLRKMGTYKWL